MENEVEKPIKSKAGWKQAKKFIDEANGDVWSRGIKTEYNINTNPPPEGLGETIKDTPIIPETKKETLEIKETLPLPDKFDEASMKEIIAQQNARIDELMRIVTSNTSKDERPIIIQQVGDTKHKSYPLSMDIKPADYIKEGATFFTRGKGFLLSTYQKDGQFMHPPDDVPIYFEYYYTDPQRRGKHDDIMHYSSFTTHSKRQAEYVRACPKFNLTIFEDVSKVVKYDREMYVMLENISLKADQLTNERLFSSAAAMGIKDIQTKTKEKLKMEVMGIWLADAMKKQKQEDETMVARLSEARLFSQKE